MPRTAGPSIPKYPRHRASGQAVVTLGGKDHYLGPHGTKTSQREYDRLIGEWLAGGRIFIGHSESHDMTVAELCRAYKQFAEGYYRKNGKPTPTVDSIRVSLRMLRAMFGDTPAGEFGPLGLAAVRQRFIDDGACRRYANDHAARIRRAFRWASTQELLPISVYQALAALPGLQRGRSDARESEPIGPVADTTVDLTLPHLPTVVADMVRLQRLTGMRPAEVCILRPCDVDRSGKVWEYRPANHKNEHRDRDRVVLIGPKAQAILASYLLRGAESYCFAPAETVVATFARKNAMRKTPIGYGNGPGTNRIRRKPRRTAGSRYIVASYRRAIARACDRAFAPAEKLEPEALRSWQSEHRWAPNQLRHSAGTEIRKRFGLEAAQVVLGHSQADVTQIYAERDLQKAAAVMAEVG